MENRWWFRKLEIRELIFYFLKFIYTGGLQN